MFKCISVSLFIFILSGCSNNYVFYSVPYCMEPIELPKPSTIVTRNSITLTELPCGTIECQEFIADYQQQEIVQLESISNYVGESQLRINQYERRVELCRKLNKEANRLMVDKKKEVGLDVVA